MKSQVTRRGFLGQLGVLSGGMVAGPLCVGGEQTSRTEASGKYAAAAGETLYNGIQLSQEWPPLIPCEDSRTPRLPPYLENIPEVIPIDVGRQLFVDDFLILETTLKRTFHTARLHKNNPVLQPETELEMNGGRRPVACPFNDGLFYDPQDQLFKIWYHAGWFDGIAYATSQDGIHWERPSLDVEPGTNRVLLRGEGYMRDGVGVWLDHETADRNQRFKMFAFFRGPNDYFSGEIFTSPDGIHWSDPVGTGPCGDNTTIFYNPFRRVWVYSIRSSSLSSCSETLGRLRSYREHSNFLQSASWGKEDVFFWCGTDGLDLPAPDLGYSTQLYNVDAAPYESLMIGLLAIWRGPPNDICYKGGFPKLTELCGVQPRRVPLVSPFGPSSPHLCLASGGNLESCLHPFGGRLLSGGRRRALFLLLCVFRQVTVRSGKT